MADAEILALLEEGSCEEEAREEVQSEGEHEEHEEHGEHGEHEELEEEAREEEARQEDGYLQKQIAYRGAHVSLAVQPDAEHEEQAILHCAGVHVGLEGLNYELNPGRRCHLPDGSGEMFFVEALLVDYSRAEAPELSDQAGQGLFLVFHCPARKSARRGRVLVELQPDFLPATIPASLANPRSRDKRKYEQGVVSCQISLRSQSAAETAICQCLDPDFSDRYMGVRQVLDQQPDGSGWTFQVQWRSAHPSNTTWEPLESKFLPQNSLSKYPC